MAKQFKREVTEASEALNQIIAVADRVKAKFDEAETATQRFAKSFGLIVSNADLSKMSGINALTSATDKINKQTEQTILLEKEKIKLSQLNEKVKLSEIQLLNKQASAEAKVVAEQRKAEQQQKKNTQANEKKTKSVKMLTVAEAQLIQQQREALAKTKAIAQFRNAEAGSLQQLEAKMKLVEMAYNRLTPEQIENTKQGQRYLASLSAVRAELTKQQAAFGKHTLNVGNYAGAYNGLGNSISQIAREMPAFANSFQTGFLAISNNLPIFFDEVAKIKKANLELAQSGQPVTSVFKQIGSSLLSPMMALNAFTILLTVAGPKLIDWISGLIKGGQELTELEKRQRYANEQSKKSREFIASESSEYVGYLMKLKATNAGSKERSKIISEINDKYGVTLRNLKDEAKFQQMINDEVLKFIDYKKAQFKLQQYDEKIQLNLKTQLKLEQEISKSRERERIQSEQMRKELEKGDAANERRISLIRGARNRQIRQTQDLQNELGKANKRLEDYGYGILETEKKVDDFGYKLKGTTQDLKEFNVELSKFDVILANIQSYESEVQLRFDIRMIAGGTQLDNISQVFEDFKAGVISGIEESGTYVESELFRILNDEYDLRKKLIEEQNAFEIEQLKDKLAAESEMRLRDIEQERNEKLQEIKDSEKQLLAEGKLTAEQKAVINHAKIELDRNYQKEREKISKDIAEQERLLDLEIEKSNAKKNQDIAQNERERLDAINSTNEELYQAEQKALEKQAEERKKAEEEEKERAEKMQDWRSRLIEKGLDELRRASEEREKLIDKEIQASEKLMQTLEAQAQAGTITAQQSLAEQQKITNERTLAKQKEQQLQQQLEDIKLLYQAVEHYVDKGDTIPVATGKAFLEVKGLKAIAGTLKGFFTGTKRTVGEELGAPLLPGKDGHIVRVDGAEKILNPDQSRATGGATTDDIVDGYLFAKAVSNVALNKLNLGGSNNRFDDRVLDKLSSLEETIRNKPETQFDVNKIGQGLVEISGKTKTGNQLIHNRFIIKN